MLAAEGKEKNKSDKAVLMALIQKTTYGHAIDPSVFSAKTQLQSICARVKWLMITAENHVVLHKQMDDELGSRMAQFAVDPLKMLEFEFENFSPISRIGKPMPMDGIPDAYIISAPPMKLSTSNLKNGIEMKQPIVVANSNLEDEKGLQKSRILFGTELNKSNCLNAMSNKTEKNEVSEGGFVVWVGQCPNGANREYRLKLANLYFPLILKNLDPKHILPIAQAMVIAEEASFAVDEHTRKSFNDLVRSLTPTNAKFVLAAALSPYQTMSRFLEENLTSHQPWTEPSRQRMFTMRMGDTHVVKLTGLALEGIFRKKRIPGGYHAALNSVTEHLETSITAQNNLVRILNFKHSYEKASKKTQRLIKHFDSTTKNAFAVGQAIERSLKSYGKAPPIYFDVMAHALSFNQGNDPKSKLSKMIIEKLALSEQVPLMMRIIYLESFLDSCKTWAKETGPYSEKARIIQDVVRKNGAEFKLIVDVKFTVTDFNIIFNLL